MDSVMLGSLTFYRRLLNTHVFNRAAFIEFDHRTGETGNSNISTPPQLPLLGHGMAGVMAGSTVSFIAAPVEHIKARLQIQYQADKSQRMYSGPIDCSKKILRAHGMKGLYHGLLSTLIFRSFFAVWWSSYAWITVMFEKHSSLSTPAVNFWAGGLSAQLFWCTSYPSDVIKQRIMTDPLGGRLGDGNPRFRTGAKGWLDAAKTVKMESGWKGYWRGFAPCFLRAFPANAAALVAFEGVMRYLN